MDAVRRLWRGELALAEAFWNWAVFGGLIVNGVTSALFLFLIMGDHLIAALIVGYVPSLSYNVIVSIGVWRSAARYAGEKKWADLARVITLAAVILMSVT